MADYKDYYKILGVSKNATDAEIKKAFKTQARKYHPDMHPESEKAAMTEKFKDVNEAYEVLSDKKKRTIYDQVGSGEYQNYARGGGASAAGARGGSAYSSGGRGGAQYYQYSGNPFGGADVNFNGTGGFNASDFSDFFQNIFGGMGGFGGGRKTSRRANPFAGYGVNESGYPADEEAEYSLSLADAYRGGIANLTMPDGRNAQVKFPPKIADGAKIKLKGLGSNGRDLYVNIKIAPDAHFRLDGKDIHVAADIMPWTAALGGYAAVNMPDGSSVKIKIPAGSHSGRKLKLSGRGLGKNGDMYVELRINNPNILSKRQKELFALLKETE